MALCWIAIAAGALGMVVAAKALVSRRFGPWALAGCGPRLGGHARWGRCGHRWRGRRGGHHGFGAGVGKGFWLRPLFLRLDTTPGQEREIRAAIEDLERSARDAKEGMKAARAALARAIGGEVFDDEALGEAQTRVDASAEQVKGAFAAALKRIHAVLDASQRELLAEMLANGRGLRGRRRNPYRDAAI